MISSDLVLEMLETATKTFFKRLSYKIFRQQMIMVGLEICKTYVSIKIIEKKESKCL